MTHQRTVTPGPLHGAVTVPSSKSHSIRALLLAAWAEGESTLKNVLDSGDTRSCIGAICALGARVEIIGEAPTGLEVRVRGMARRTAATAIDVGNSGTTLYLATALAATLDVTVRFDGDESIRGRSAAPLLAALSDLGATVVEHGAPGCTPFEITGPLSAGPTSIECRTSQYLSALLLATPLAHTAGGDSTTIEVPLLFEAPYVDITTAWLDRQRIRYERDGYARFVVPAEQRYRPLTAIVPGDFSSATFWFVAGALSAGGLSIAGLNPDDVQGDKGVLDILSTMGASVTWRTVDGAPMCYVAGPLTGGGTFDLNAMPDALPALAVAACFAGDVVELSNVSQARIKETDRIAVMAAELARLGAAIEERPDGLRITPHHLTGGTVHSHGDHRVAMALAVAGAYADGAVTIDRADAAAVTYPAFFTEFARLQETG